MVYWQLLIGFRQLEKIDQKSNKLRSKVLGQGRDNIIDMRPGKIEFNLPYFTKSNFFKRGYQRINHNLVKGN